MAKKIFVVDDEEDILEVVKEILSINGYESSVFSDSKSCLLALEKKKVPNLLILDMRMPGITGPEMVIEIRKNKKFDKMKIVFFTANSKLESDFKKRYKIQGLIEKPFNINEFVAKVKKFL